MYARPQSRAATPQYTLRPAIGNGDARSTSERLRRSKATAIPNTAMPMMNPLPGLRSRSVCSNSAADPPAPTSEPMTTMPRHIMIVWLMAVTNDLTAWGACTFHSSCQLLEPNMWPASTDAVGHLADARAR